MTALELITGSLRLIGAIETGESPEAPEASDALAILNQLLESLSLSTQGVFNSPTQTFNLIASQSTYTIGIGGNFNTVTPVNILDAYVSSNGISFPVEIISQNKYDSIVNKTQQSTYPIYLLQQNTVPLGNIILWPVPSAASTLTINIAAQFAQIPLLATVITTWPAGAARMIRYLLAIDLAEEYGSPITQTLQMKAAEAKADYMRANARPTPSMRFGASLSGGHSGYGYTNFIAGN